MTNAEDIKMSYDAALSLIDGKAYKLDGVGGTIKVDRRDPLRLRVEHVPSKAGMRSEAYQAIKRQLRDDYVTDLTWSDRLVEIMITLGCKF